MRLDRNEEAGFTLIELLVVLVVLPLIMGGVAAAILAELDNTSQSDPNGSFVRLANSHDTQITSAYFVRDVESASVVSTDPGDPARCNTTQPQLLGLSWTQGTYPALTTVDVSYGISSTTPFTLVRRYCLGSLPEVDSTLSNYVFPPSIVSPPTLTNASCAAGVSSCAQSGATTYVTAAVKCVAPSTVTYTCANDGLFSVLADPTSGKPGITSIQLSVLENQITGYQYQLTGVPRLSDSTAGGQTPPGADSIPPFMSNGPVDGGTCNLLSNGLAVVNDSTGSAVTIKQPGVFDATGIYTSGGSVSGSGSYPAATTGATPISSPYDQLTELSTLLGGNPSTVTLNGNIYNVVYESANPWSPTGSLAPAIYVVENGMSVTGTKDLTGNALIYVTGGSVTLGGKGNISLGYLPPQVPNWEITPKVQVTAINGSQTAVNNPASISSLTLQSVPETISTGDTIVMSDGPSTLDLTADESVASATQPTTVTVDRTIANGTYTPGTATAFDQPLPEPVVWVSRNDVLADSNPPSLVLGGNGGAVAVNGAIYAPTAVTTINGGGSAGGVDTQALDVGALSCNGGGSVPWDVTAGSPLNSLTVNTPQPASITLGASDKASILVTGTGYLAPTGTATVYACGPYVSEPTSDPACTNTTSGAVSVNPGPKNNPPSVTLAPDNATGTASGTSASYTPTLPGWYCFATYYPGSVSYNSSQDTTTDGCFDVVPPPVVTIAQPNQPCYASSPGKKCIGAWSDTASIAGTATEPAGPGVKQVNLTFKDPNNDYWNGTTWSATSSNFSATLTGPVLGTWTFSYDFPAADFPVDSKNGKPVTGTYTITATATDTSGTTWSATPVSFDWNG